MKTEARKAFAHGFVLTEQELRRTVDTATQQMQRVDPSQAPVIDLEVKLRNGTIIQSSSLDDILSFENFGSRQIVRLMVGIHGQIGPENRKISFQFTNVNVENDVSQSIRYAVVGDDRDWVLVTSSELDERIGRVKCFAWDQLVASRQGRSLLPILLMLAFLVGSAFGMLHTIGVRPKVADTMEARWKAGALHDPIEAMIMMQREFESREAPSPTTLLKYSFLYPALGVLGLVFCGFFISYLYPAYVFGWGDYLKTYDKRLATRRLVFVGIILALAIPIIASVIVEKMHLGR